MTPGTRWTTLLMIIAALALGGCAAMGPNVPGAAAPRYDRSGLFRAMDNDGDQRISRQEYYSIYEDQDTAKKFFDLYDRNGNGYLEPGEFHAPGITIFKW